MTQVSIKEDFMPLEFHILQRHFDRFQLITKTVVNCYQMVAHETFKFNAALSTTKRLLELKRLDFLLLIIIRFSNEIFAIKLPRYSDLEISR